MDKEVIKNKLRLEQEIWLLTGMVINHYKEDDLKVIFEKYKSINMVPNGYKYPELAKKSHLPDDMRQMLDRKAKHIDLPRND